MDTLELPNLATVLSSVEIASTEDLTRTLRAASLPLQQRLTLAWAILDSSRVDGDAGVIQRLSAILVRKNELLVEWLLSTIRRELKTAKPSDYALFRDPAAISLLTRILENINDSLPSGTLLDVHTVLDGPFMTLFVSAFSRELTTHDLSYITAVTKLWRFIVESTADGMEAVSTQLDGLTQLLSLVTAKYLRAADDNDNQLRDSFLGMLGSVFHAMRNACESTLVPRKCFALFDKDMLPQLLRLITVTSEDVTREALDMLHAGLFHVDPMRKFATELLDRVRHPTAYPATYVSPFFATLTSALESQDLAARAQYAAALPDILARYLQASALVCNETRSQATTTIGLPSVAASPASRSREDISNTCLEMFTYMYKLLQPLSSDERFLAATNRLVAAYFGDQCFGTVSNASIASGDIYHSQITILDAWLGETISPIFRNPKATPNAIALALAGIDTALEAGPDTVQARANQLLDAFSHIPVDATQPASSVLNHLVSTLAKARQLDTLFEKLVQVQVDRSARGSKYVNLLMSAPFIRAINQAISQSMPFAPATACVSVVSDAVVAEASKLSGQGNGDEGRKRRRTSQSGKSSNRGSEFCAERLEMLATIAANVVLASATTVSTEHQREQYFQLLTAKYEELCVALSSDGVVWERLLLHYAFMEVASRIDGTERWLETCMYPERVRKSMLPTSGGDTRSARVDALAMLVAFQTAAHWSVFVSSISAGIIPQSVLESANVEEAAAAVKQMVTSVFDNSGFCIAPADDELAGWGEWDGQAHSIGATNHKSAQWKLLADWLELACEYADSRAIDAIASRIVAELASSPPLSTAQSQALLCSASFFEVARIRDAFAPALAEFSATTLKQQLEQQKTSSKKSSAMGSGVLEVLNWLTASTQKKSGKGKGNQMLATMDFVIEKLGAQDLALGKHRLKGSQASTWVQLFRGLLCFPTAYWSAERAHVVLALALAVDLGFANMCKHEDDALRLRIHSRAVIERLFKCLPSASAGLVQHAPTIVDHWAGTARLSDELILPSRRLVRLVMGSLAQAAFGQSMDAASTTCRELCARLYASVSSDSRSDESSLADVLTLDSLDAVAKVAAVYAQKVQAKGRDKEWCSLVKSWLKQIAQLVCADFDRMSQDGSEAASDTHSTCRLGVLVSLSSLYKSLAGADKVPSHVLDIARRAAESLPQLSQSTGTFALGLVLLSVHNYESAGAGCHVILAYLTHQLAAISARDAKGDAMPLALQSLVASIAGADCDAVTAMPLADAIVSYAVEPLLKNLDHSAFAASLDTFLKLMSRPGQHTTASVGSMLLAYIRTAYRQLGNSSATTKRKAVQRRLGSILTTLHAAMRVCPTASTILFVLGTVSELVLEPAMHFTMFDVGETLSMIFTAVTLPLPDTTGADLPSLYRSACKLLGAVVRHHTNEVLDSVSVTVAVLRALLHAFVTPSFPRSLAASTTRQRFEIDCSQTPWIVAYAPFPISCAESYSRVVAELASCRRFLATGADKDNKSGKAKQTSDKAAQSGSEFVKLTKGTNTAGATSVLSMYVSYIISEYCIIQGGGALSTLSSKHSMSSGNGESTGYSFQGLSWRPAPVMRAVDATSGAVLRSEVGMRGTISTPLVREALLPGWYALLDVLGGDDRNTLLTLLAGSSGDSRQSSYGWTSIFGPDRYGGAHEVLKSLYQSYLDYFKYKGQV